MSLRLKVFKMTSNLISSMTPLNRPPASGHPGSDAGARLAVEESELAWLARLDALLKAMGDWLSAGNAAELPDISREVALIAQRLSILYSQSPLLASLAEDAERRKRLLAELRQRQRLCAALLRRWHRRLMLQREVVRMAGETATYAAAVLPATGWR